MTVQDLIEKLQKVEDKSLPVFIEPNEEVYYYNLRRIVDFEECTSETARIEPHILLK